MDRSWPDSARSNLSSPPSLACAKADQEHIVTRLSSRLTNSIQKSGRSVHTARPTLESDVPPVVVLSGLFAVFIFDDLDDAHSQIYHAND
jgi:hypothetical protein